MNVLHVNMSLDPVSGGGTVERISQLHMAMNEAPCIASKVLSLDLGVSSALTQSNDVVLLPCLNRRWYLPLPNFVIMYRMAKWADVIHLMNHWTILNAFIYLVARMTGTPYVICPAGALPVFGRSKGFKGWYNLLVGKALVRNCAAAIAVAEEERSLLKEYGVNEELIFHVPNGVNPQDFSYLDDKLFREHIGIKQAEYILFVGRINHIKGPDILLDAFIALSQSLPDLALVFAGPDGGMQSMLESKSKAEGLMEQVYFAGFVGGDLKSSAYHGASLLVVPSRQEAMSIVALEAAICATPVLLTDRCGFDELSHAGAAKLTKANTGALGEAINALMLDEGTRCKMGKKGHQFALEGYSWEMSAKKCLGVFKQVGS